jgi:paraquat-inducible protein B
VDESILRRKSDRIFELSDDDALQAAIERGLRARLEAESLVTGVLYVELGFHPDAGPPVYHQVEPKYRELPTQPNTVQALLENLASLDMAGLSDRLDSVLQRLDEGLGELDVAQLNQSVTNLLGSVQALITSPGLTNAVTDIDKTVLELRELSAILRRRVPDLADTAESTLEQLKKAAADLHQTSEQLRAVLAPHSPLSHGLIETVEDLGDASRALKDLAEYLQRNPNAVISGRARPDHAP